MESQGQEEKEMDWLVMLYIAICHVLAKQQLMWQKGPKKGSKPISTDTCKDIKTLEIK